MDAVTLHGPGDVRIDVLPDLAWTTQRRQSISISAADLENILAVTRPDVLIDAVATCCAEADVELVIVGSGRHQLELEQRAKARGLGDRVRFRGQLITPLDVRAELDRADLFVLPSRQEGLPRAMIEAMARGLPCIGSTVGGIPELLAAEDMVPPNDASALARKIREVLADPSRLARMSVRNLAKAREYSLDVLTRRRERFYEHVRAQTEAWLKQSLNGKRDN